MPRPVKWCSEQGLLLVEAVLSAVVIATGLVFISRGLAGQLRALRTMEEYETVLALANRKLAELEAQGLLLPSPIAEQAEGEMRQEGSGTAYHWKLTTSAALQDPETKEDVTRQITLVVGRADGHAPVVRLSAMWPAQWIPQEWPEQSHP